MALQAAAATLLCVHARCHAQGHHRATAAAHAACWIGTPAQVFRMGWPSLSTGQGLPSTSTGTSSLRRAGVDHS